MPTTSNFGWTTPADTDLVKDGAAAIRTLGNGIDTSFLDLKGGTSGQVLSKNSNTDLDYTWVTPNVGDITEVQAGTGISIASGTGPIPVVTNTVATAFDAAGDLVYGTGADTFTKLSLGTAGQVLKVNSGATAPEWATAGGAGLVYLTGATFTSVTSVSLPNDTFTTTYDWYQIHLSVTSTANVSPTGRLRASGSDDTNNSYYNGGRRVNIGLSANDISTASTSFDLSQMNTNNSYMGRFLIGNPKVAKRTFLEYGISTIESGNSYFQVTNGTGGFAATTAFDSFSFIFGSNCTGNYTVYGYALS